MSSIRGQKEWGEKFNIVYHTLGNEGLKVRVSVVSTIFVQSRWAY